MHGSKLEYTVPCTLGIILNNVQQCNAYNNSCK